MAPEEKYGTVLFCDIRNFTSLFDDRDPIEAAIFAKNVLAKMGRVVEDNRGIVDQFTGDGFFAHYGFEKEVENHAEHACQTVVDLRKTLTDINNMRYFDIQMMINVGIGIHTGEAAYCEISTENFKQTTVMGDTVNTASRIGDLTKYFIVDTLVSKETYDLVKDKFMFQKLHEKNIRGKKNSIHTYWLLPLNL
ncbi:MAG: adenylate/guanylate cyclase domain-containing protein [Balneolaceae bacterium]|nr:adenylate/guanylate cyclase domain-containing protein [Balneolaceae bacterium]